MNYHKSSGDEYPKLVDITSSPTTVYLRKNIRAVEFTDDMTGETKTEYQYEEAIITKDEYMDILRNQTEELENALAELLFGGDE
jgi:hypothetical protein